MVIREGFKTTKPIIETYKDYEKGVDVYVNTVTGDKIEIPIGDTLTATQYNPEPMFYGKTAAEWLAIEKERNELKQYIEEKLDAVLEDLKKDD